MSTGEHELETPTTTTVKPVGGTEASEAYGVRLKNATRAAAHVPASRRNSAAAGIPGEIGDGDAENEIARRIEYRRFAVPVILIQSGPRSAGNDAGGILGRPGGVVNEIRT